MAKKNHKIIKYVLSALLLIVVCLIGIAVYYYSQGSSGNYTPPAVESSTNVEQVLADLNSISQAVDSYYAMNLSYPSKLKDLEPDFINKVPVEPRTNNEYKYQVFADSAFQVTVQNPQNYNLKELFIRNGKIVKH